MKNSSGARVLTLCFYISHSASRPLQDPGGVPIMIIIFEIQFFLTKERVKEPPPILPKWVPLQSFIGVRFSDPVFGAKKWVREWTQMWIQNQIPWGEPRCSETHEIQMVLESQTLDLGFNIGVILRDPVKTSRPPGRAWKFLAEEIFSIWPLGH